MNHYSNSKAVNNEVNAITNPNQIVKVKPSEMRYVYLVLACATLLAIGLSMAGLVK